MFESTYITILSNTQRSIIMVETMCWIQHIKEIEVESNGDKDGEPLGKESGWIIDSVIDHNNNISKYNPLDGSRFIKLLKELNRSIKGLTFKMLTLINALNGVS